MHTVKQYNFACIKFRECFIFGLSQGIQFRRYIEFCTCTVYNKEIFFSTFYFYESCRIYEFMNFYTMLKYVASQHTGDVGLRLIRLAFFHLDQNSMHYGIFTSLEIFNREHHNYAKTINYCGNVGANFMSIEDCGSIVMEVDSRSLITDSFILLPTICRSLLLC